MTMEKYGRSRGGSLFNWWETWGLAKGSMEDRITEEISYLTERIDKLGGQSIEIHSILTPSMSNNVSHLVFGHRLDAEDPKRIMFDKVIDQASPLFSPIGMLAICPKWFSNLALTIGALSQKKVLTNHLATFRWAFFLLDY